jgi:hypothetical protein
MTTLSLLSERRAAVTELRRADAITRGLIQFRIDEIDRELAESKVIARVEATVNCAEGWSVAQFCRGDAGA